MQAFLNDSKVKSFYLKRVAAHIKADQLVQGYGYFDDGKGCAVGCTLHSSNHMDYEKLLGIPIILARLEDRIFERLTKEESRKWPTRFLKAPKVGADLSLVWPKFAVWLLTDEKCGVIRFAKKDETKKAIQDVSNLWQKVADGENAKDLQNKFREARKAAYAAAYAAYAAYAAAYAAAAAADAADADADAAYDAAYAAYAAAAADADADAAYAYAAARKIHWTNCADKLIELMSEAK